MADVLVEATSLVVASRENAGTPALTVAAVGEDIFLTMEHDQVVLSLDLARAVLGALSMATMEVAKRIEAKAPKVAPEDPARRTATEAGAFTPD